MAVGRATEGGVLDATGRKTEMLPFFKKLEVGWSWLQLAGQIQVWAAAAGPPKRA